MKEKIIYTLCLFMLIGAGCSDNEKQDIIPLRGTSWKLAGFVDVGTGVLTVPEPQDCKECYTLTFDTDYTATGRSITMDVKIDLKHLNPDIAIEKMYIDEGHRHGHDFRMAILVTGSFSVSPGELKLFNKNKTNYLLFKLIQQ
jgi:hypothetical protein